MKNLSFIAGLCLLAGTSFAQHDNLSNLSAEWVRTPARNAATDASDIVVYNPAGLVRLNNGFHINVGNQSLFRKPSHISIWAWAQVSRPIRRMEMISSFLICT
ncbi:MAG: hypothetical protein IPP46_01100 [Bacteroidetes bacterium]|nr:hypothetical protein [Bacteroidota bacterium]